MLVRPPLLVWLRLANILQRSEARRVDCKCLMLKSIILSKFTRVTRNIAQVSGGERELRSTYLKPFNRACLDSLSIMTAYSTYDGIPAVANTRELSTHLSMNCPLIKVYFRSIDRYCTYDLA